MATRKPKAEESQVIEILEIERGEIQFCILGTSPLILNRMSEKAKQSIFLPEKKSAATKASTLKHDPYEEFRASAYRMEDPKAPTELAVLPGMFKGAMRTAALDMQGSNKAQIGRLVTLVGEYTPLWGVPKLFISVTRSADVAKTPDIRTRCIVPEWACRVVVQFTKPRLNQTSIINLLAAAGVQSGVGDWRQEKGSGSFGSFKIVAESDADFKRIIKAGGRREQMAAFASPMAYNKESAELCSWFDSEAKRRGHAKGKGKGDEQEPLAA